MTELLFGIAIGIGIGLVLGLPFAWWLRGVAIRATVDDGDMEAGW